MRDYADQINSIRLCAESDDPVDECCWEDCNQHHGSRDNMCRQKIMLDAADAIEELLAAVPKWISVRDVSDGEIRAAKMVLSVIENLDPPMLMYDIEKSAVKKALLLMLRICEAEPPKEVE